MLSDRHAIRREIFRIKRSVIDASPEETIQKRIHRIENRLQASVKMRAWRKANLPSPIYNDDLPITSKKEEIIEAMDQYAAQLQHVLVHTGQHYDERMSKAFFDDLGMPRPDVDLGVGSGSHAEQTARIMVEFERVCLRESPDLVVVVGDVNSTMACAITAKKLGIKVAHVEAGLRSRDMSMPEEINRLCTDALCDYLFTTDRLADENLRREGVAEEKIHFVGNVMIDTLLKHQHMAGIYEQAPDIEVTAACDINAATLAAFCERYGIARAYATPGELFSADGVDAVSIAVIPEPEKSRLAIEAMGTGSPSCKPASIARGNASTTLPNPAWLGSRWPRHSSSPAARSGRWTSWEPGRDDSICSRCTAPTSRP